MSEILSLREIFQREGLQFVKKIFDEFVVISEKLNATRFCFERTDKGIDFYKKDGKITAIDRTMASLYEHPIKYIESLPKEIILELPIGFRYGFRYFHTEKPANISYDKIPLNGLVLTDIRTPKDKIVDDVSILNGISDLLSVEKPPILWYGKLDEAQKTRLLEYLRTPEDQLEKKFQTTSFTKYIISILNPEIKTTSLKNDIEKPIDSIIFKFLTEEGKEIIHAKVIDPVIMQMNRSNESEREPQDLYGIILSDVVEFIKINGLKKYNLSKGSYDERYIELICQIYNAYMKKNEYKYEGIEIDPLSFASVPQFDLNTGFITDLSTREYIQKSTINKHIFKILMSSFSKPKKKPSGTVTQILIDDVLDLTKKIKNLIESTPEMKESSFPTYEEYVIKKKENSWKIKD